MELKRGAEADLPTPWGDFRVVAFIEPDVTHVALLAGDLATLAEPLVRIHSECLTGDIFRSYRCDCGEQLHVGMERIASEGGVLIYLRGHEGRGIGLAHKIEAYRVSQEMGMDTVEANMHLGLPVDIRDYTIGAAILRDLGVSRIRLLTNNPAKIEGLEAGGIEVLERLAVQITPNPHNVDYLNTKRLKMGHLLENI